MSQTQQDYAAQAYAPRAADYVTSAVHAAGPDLDRIEWLLRGRAQAYVLDLGCGGGHVSYRAAPHVARVTAVDVTAAMLAQVAREAQARGLRNIETCEAAAEALPFAAQSFDAVLCRFTAHHWQNVPAGLAEVRRVLKPGGLAVFIDTVAPASAVLDTHLQALELLRDSSHVRNYSVAEWQTMLKAAGFAAAELATHRLTLDFRSWLARTRTPPVMEAAIAALLAGAPDAVKQELALDGAGHFAIEAAMFVTAAV